MLALKEIMHYSLNGDQIVVSWTFVNDLLAKYYKLRRHKYILTNKGSMGLKEADEFVDWTKNKKKKMYYCKSNASF